MQILNGRKGISSLQLQRDTVINRKTAYRILKQIRLAMGTAQADKIFDAIVEIDETYIGGKPRKGGGKRGRGTSKTPVVGIKARNDKQVYAVVALPNEQGQKLTGKQLLVILNKVCAKETIVISDDFWS
jgi:hypothetical protein